ncbi:hypothetical protein B0T25DRAFT_612777 [Lasiosphaeria hispida]|uniref:Uncharacterized protein n=1 Tax=Lasiosphaeria hispida TaxID=260671 RepID=A0AAJ0MB01_9PEZI|nr:hypothetical protein B0T25DRAFT_612777 [Lasiosphaeria hispida]
MKLSPTYGSDRQVRGVEARDPLSQRLAAGGNMRRLRGIEEQVEAIILARDPQNRPPSTAGSARPPPAGAALLPLLLPTVLPPVLPQVVHNNRPPPPPPGRTGGARAPAGGGAARPLAGGAARPEASGATARPPAGGAAGGAGAPRPRNVDDEADYDTGDIEARGSNVGSIPPSGTNNQSPTGGTGKAAGAAPPAPGSPGNSGNNCNASPPAFGQPQPGS